MAVISVVLADIRVFYPKFPVDRNREPVQYPNHFCSVFFVHGPWLVPDHPLPQLFNQLLHLGTGKLSGNHELVQVIGCPEECLIRGKTEMFGEENEVNHEPVPEFTGHTHGL